MVTEQRRAEFRQYLQDTGVVKALTKALLKLYELKYNRPDSALLFIQEQLCSKIPSLTEYENLKHELRELRAKLPAGQHIQNMTDSGSKIYDASRCGSLLSARQSELVRKGGRSNTPKDENEALISLLHNPKSHSLLKKYMTLEMYDKFKDVKTSLGVRLIDCISSGLKNDHSRIGVYVADPDAYDTFSELLSPIIKDYHLGFTDKMYHPDLNWGDPSQFKSLDPENKYITSTRIRCIRSVADFPLSPLMTQENYVDLMEKIKDTLTSLEGELSGNWYALEEMDTETKQNMVNCGYVLEQVDKFLLEAGATKFWPKGRAIYINEAKNFFVWVNEEDHLRFIAIDVGSDVGNLYSRIINAVEQCSKKLEFVKHSRFGWLSLCPTNLGGTLRASVMIRLPNLISTGKLRKLAEESHLEIRPTQYDDDGVREISNKRKLGLTEFDEIKELYDGITKIIAAEKLFE